LCEERSEDGGLESLTVGTKIDVGKAISKSTDLLRANPSIILIQAIPAIPALLGDVSGSSTFAPLGLIAGIVSAVLAVIAGGAYAPVVREALVGQKLTIGEALGHAYNRFWSLLGAAILVVIIVGPGTIAFVVPGIIFATWYAYTTPAIMLEDKGATAGMAASKAFGRDKKWSTFSIFLIFVLAYILVSVLGLVLSIGGGGRVIQTLLTIPLEAWTSVVIAYTYIVHGPSASVPQGPPTQSTWQQPPPSAGLPAVAQPASSHFCSQCGSPLKPDSRFCSNCGKPV